MPPKKEDRRVRLTKLAIRESLVELMQQQPIGKISVKMICEAADINRSTFYAHYADQHQLLDSLQREMAAGIREHISATRFTDGDDAVEVVVQVLVYARQNAALFQVLLGEHGNYAFHRELMHLVREKTLEELRGKGVDAAVSRYVELFAVNGILSIIRAWLQAGCPESPAAFAQLILKLMMQGVSSLYPPFGP